MTDAELDDLLLKLEGIETTKPILIQIYIEKKN